MAVDNNAKVNVTGSVIPKLEGQNIRYGNWFLIDQDGSFSLDKSVVATIWLVGGGCNGDDGIWNGNIIENGNTYPTPNSGTGDSYSGKGGDGGYVLVVGSTKISKGQTLTSVIAQIGDKRGTSLDLGNTILRCDDVGGIARIGGASGVVPLATPDKYADSNGFFVDPEYVIEAKAGEDGVETPYGYVGSSGGGGAACNGQTNANNGVTGGIGAGSGTSHRTAGTSAKNYGCGGGGGAVCGAVAKGQLGGSGMQGCIVIAYTIEEKTLIVERHYSKKTTINRNCNTNYASSQNSSHSTSCGCGCGCGCSGNNSSDGVTSDNYTDKVNIKGNVQSANELVLNIQNVETENLALLKRVQELENKLK